MFPRAREAWTGTLIRALPQAQRLFKELEQALIGDRSRLTESWIEEMLEPHIQVNDLAPWHSDWPHPQIRMYESVSWGLGWGIANANGEDSFWHWGANVPFHAFAAGFRKQRMGIIAMTNSESGRDIWKDLIPESICSEHPELSWLEDLYEQMPT